MSALAPLDIMSATATMGEAPRKSVGSQSPLNRHRSLGVIRQTSPSNLPTASNPPVTVKTNGATAGPPRRQSPGPPGQDRSALANGRSPSTKDLMTGSMSPPFLTGSSSPLIPSAPSPLLGHRQLNVVSPIDPSATLAQGHRKPAQVLSSGNSFLPQPTPDMTAKDLHKDYEKRIFSMSAASRCIPHPALGRSPNEVLEKMQVVCLGSSCGVKMTLRRLGLDEATMPFDWIRTRSSGIVNWLQTGFNDFFRSPFHRMEVIFREIPMTVYRSHTHSFWHDDIEDLATRQKLWRRIQRFLDLAVDSTHSVPRKLLFVRSACTSAELDDSETMYRALQQNFAKAGREVWLLIIVEDQQMDGPIMHQLHERLIHYMTPSAKGPLSTTAEGTGPYETPIAFVVRLMLGDPTAASRASQFPRVARCSEIVCQGSPFLQLGCKPCEAGIWAGKIKKKSDMKDIMFCAFEGHSDREVAWAYG